MKGNNRKRMKANEAPEKLYMNWVNYPLEEMQVEYTHTDAFIEKAAKWLDETLRNTDFYEDEIELMVQDFKKAMKS